MSLHPGARGARARTNRQVCDSVVRGVGHIYEHRRTLQYACRKCQYRGVLGVHRLGFLGYHQPRNRQQLPKDWRLGSRTNRSGSNQRSRSQKNVQSEARQQICRVSDLPRLATKIFPTVFTSTGVHRSFGQSRKWCARTKVPLRQSRTRATLGVIAVTLAALGLSSCSSGPSKTDTLVPWVALAATSTTTTTTTTTTLASAPACLATQLRASMGRGGAGLGNDLTVVVFTNTGGACRLSGYPDLVGQRVTGTPVLLRARKTGTYFGNLVPTDLATRGRGELLLGTADGCTALNEPSQAEDAGHARADTYASLKVILPNGVGSLSVDHISLDVACGLDESQLGTQPPTPGEVNAPPGSPQSLEAGVTVPRRVKSGTTMRYVVALYNPDRRVVTWEYCPNYTELVLTTPSAGRSRTFSRTYQLNCAQAKSVGPKRTVTFVMELPIGKIRGSSEAKFSWQLGTGYGPYAGHSVFISAAE